MHNGFLHGTCQTPSFLSCCWQSAFIFGTLPVYSAAHASMQTTCCSCRTTQGQTVIGGSNGAQRGSVESNTLLAPDTCTKLSDSETSNASSVCLRETGTKGKGNHGSTRARR
jgi:hypothetical protein